MHMIIKIVGAGFPRPDNDSYHDNVIFCRDRSFNEKTSILNDDKNEYYGNGHGNHKGRGNPAPTLGQIVAYFKYGTTKQINMIRNTPGARLWQRNYHEHVIRGEEDMGRVREYVVGNPALWKEDEYYFGPRPYDFYDNVTGKLEYLP